ncbi:MAG: hypothetical protein IT204_23360 [Fimbriimonadaceae bacterium]|nr:hypothetical protein [Fimbriimonadaceae bacterium]
MPDREPWGEWRLQTAWLAGTAGAALSQVGVDTATWHRSSLPSTVLAALTRDGTYPDVRVWPHAFRVPDSSDAFNAEHGLGQYSHLPDGRNPWRDPWWYRTEFELPALAPTQRAWLTLHCLNYRAEVWLNGQQLADREQLAGMFQRFRLDLTDHLAAGRNALAVLVYPVDHPGDPTVQTTVFGAVRNFHSALCNDVTEVMSVGYDCFPTVPDRNLGLVQEVTLNLTGPVDLRHPFVRTALDLPDLNPARLTVSVELLNASAATVRGRLEGSIADPQGTVVATFSRPVTLLSHETREITVTATDAPALRLADPQLWWPNTYGGQPLYRLDLRFGESTVSTRFGIRRVDRELHEADGAPGLRLLINGVRIFQRGGYVQPEMMFAWDRDRVAAELRYLAHANLNYLAFEDIPNPPDWYVDLCDELGLLLWQCYYDCYWLQYNRPWDIDVALLEDCTVDLARRYRNHPALVVNMAQNEGETRQDVYELWRRTMLRHDPDRLLIPSGSFPSDRPDTPAWFDRELPTGCNDYPPKTYGWQLPRAYFELVRDHRNWMFMIESGAASVPPIESLLRFMPHLAELGPNPGDPPHWPLDAAWAHYGANSYYEWFDRGLRLLYGEPRDLADYCRKAHLTTYDQHRAMFEAVHHRMWDLTSGFGEWKLNSAFPDIQWQLYDWYLRPMVSLYAVRRACAAAAVLLSPLDQGVTVVNNRQQPRRGLTVTAAVYSSDARLLHHQQATVEVPANACARALTFDPPAAVRAAPLQFVRLSVHDAAGVLQADNFYWLSPRLDDVVNHFTGDDFRRFPSNQPWYLPRQTPCLPELADLPPTTVTLRASRHGSQVTVELANDSAHLAFFLRARLLRDGQELLPVYWSDNYVSLLPGETLTLTAELPGLAGDLQVAIDGWNIAPTSVPVG